MNSIKRNFTGFGEDPAVDFGGGTYQVTLNAVGTDRAQLISVGRCGGSEAQVALSLRNFARAETSGGRLAAPKVLRNAVTAVGSMTLGGNIEVNGDIASAVSITANGNAGSVNGNANAPAISDKHGQITGVKGNDASRYAFSWDSFLRLEDYLAHAVTWDGRSLDSYPDNTILYVNGSITMASATALRLCIIATGDIQASGQVTLLQPATYPTLVSREGSIKLTGGSQVDGLIAAMGPSGDIQTTGGGNTPVNINGSLLVGGDFKDNGNWCIHNSYSPTMMLAPPGSSITEDYTVIVAWQ